MLSRPLYNLYIEGRAVTAESDIFYPGFIKAVGLFRPRQVTMIANPQTDVVIEGFPRSANTYFLTVFQLAQNKPVKIATHLHESYQVRFAERHDIPCLVLVRSPLDAVISSVLRDDRLNSGMLLRNYCRFYKQVLLVHRKSVIAPFDIVTSDPNRFITQINARYGTAFSTLADSDHQKVIEELENKDKRAFGTEQLDPLRIAAPSVEKRNKKHVIATMIENRHANMLHKAQSLYENVLELGC